MTNVNKTPIEVWVKHVTTSGQLIADLAKALAKKGASTDEIFKQLMDNAHKASQRQRLTPLLPYFQAIALLAHEIPIKTPRSK